MNNTKRAFIPIYCGQVWSVADNYRSIRRQAVVIATTDRINDPDEHGERVTMVNTESGRHAYMKATTLRAYWRLEGEAGDEQQ